MCWIIPGLKLEGSLKQMDFLKIGFNKNELGKLFFACVFPIHGWTIHMVLREVAWVAKRTDVGIPFGLLLMR
jgi:hypothetical protein